MVWVNKAHFFLHSHPGENITIRLIVKLIYYHMSGWDVLAFVALGVIPSTIGFLLLV